MFVFISSISRPRPPSRLSSVACKICLASHQPTPSTSDDSLTDSSHTVLVSRYLACRKPPRSAKPRNLVSRFLNSGLLPRRPNTHPLFSIRRPTRPCRTLPTSSTKGSVLPLIPAASTATPHHNRILFNKVSCFRSFLLLSPLLPRYPSRPLFRLSFLPWWVAQTRETSASSLRLKTARNMRLCNQASCHKESLASARLDKQCDLGYAAGMARHTDGTEKESYELPRIARTLPEPTYTDCHRSRWVYQLFT